MAETAVKEKANGIPVPEEGTEEFARMNKMAKIAIPIVLIIFTMGVLQQQAFGMIYVNIGDQLGQANLAPLITSIPGIVLGIVCVIYGSLGDFVSLKKMMILGTIVFVLGSILGCFGDLRSGSSSPPVPCSPQAGRSPAPSSWCSSPSTSRRRSESSGTACSSPCSVSPRLWASSLPAT